jgi:ABC-type glycerol-3-phosphate transport system substrate-binding protein
MRLYNSQGGRDAITKFHLANGAPEASAGNPVAGDYNRMFQLGKVATWVNTYAHRTEQFRPQGFSDENWDYTTLPLPPGGRVVNWGGSHAFSIPLLAKNPDAGWAWLEHFSLFENDLRFALRYDRVPIRRSTASSDEYLRGDPFLAHQIEQIWYRVFLPAVPGMAEILPIWNRPLGEVYTGQKSARTAVDQLSQEMQVALDRAHGKIR